MNLSHLKNRFFGEVESEKKAETITLETRRRQIIVDFIEHEKEPSKEVILAAWPGREGVPQSCKQCGRPLSAVNKTFGDLICPVGHRCKDTGPLTPAEDSFKQFQASVKLYEACLAKIKELRSSHKHSAEMRPLIEKSQKLVKAENEAKRKLKEFNESSEGRAYYQWLVGSGGMQLAEHSLKKLPADGQQILKKISSRPQTEDAAERSAGRLNEFEEWLKLGGVL